MAACRGLDVLMGAGAGRVRAALPAAAALTVHTAGVTVLSRGEVHGTTPPVAAAVTAGTLGVAGAVAAGALRSLRRGPTAALAASGPAARGAAPHGRARTVVSAVAALASAGSTWPRACRSRLGRSVLRTRRTLSRRPRQVSGRWFRSRPRWPAGAGAWARSRSWRGRARRAGAARQGRRSPSPNPG
ncbi:hypothetical protein NKG05_17745 [Oerskovia sp. M15]